MLSQKQKINKFSLLFFFKKNLCLIQRSRLFDERSNHFRVGHGRLQLVEFSLFRRARINLRRKRNNCSNVGGNGKNVELFVAHKTSRTRAQRQDEAFHKSSSDFSLRRRAQPSMDIHGHRVQLTQAGHALEQQQNASSSLYRLNCARQHVGRDGLEILKNTHAKRVSENLVRLLQEEHTNGPVVKTNKKDNTPSSKPNNTRIECLCC